MSATTTEKEIVHVYAQAWNEEAMLPYFLRHYETFAARIVICDQYSTDRTRAIIEQHPLCEYQLAADPEKYAEQLHSFKSTAWKKSRGVARWVMIVDVDEFVYHPTILEYLRSERSRGVVGLRPSGYEMISRAFPKTSGQIYSEVTRGCFSEPFCKPVIFSPDAIGEVMFEQGCHEGTFYGDGLFERKSQLLLLHMKRLGHDYFSARMRMLAKRVSPAEIENGINEHYFKMNQELATDFEKATRFAAIGAPTCRPSSTSGHHESKAAILGRMVRTIPTDLHANESTADDNSAITLFHPVVLVIDPADCDGLSNSFRTVPVEPVYWNSSDGDLQTDANRHARLRLQFDSASVVMLCGKSEDAELVKSWATATNQVPIIFHVSALSAAREADDLVFEDPVFAQRRLEELLAKITSAWDVRPEIDLAGTSDVAVETGPPAMTMPARCNLQVVILANQRNVKTTRLRDQLTEKGIAATVLDPANVVFGSDRETRAGTKPWRFALDHFPWANWIWMLDENVQLPDSPTLFPTELGELDGVGCWSPVVEGDAATWMRGGEFTNGIRYVTTLQDVALAVSRKALTRAVILASECDRVVDGDLLTLASSLEGQRNILDGRVTAVWKPPRSVQPATLANGKTPSKEETGDQGGSKPSAPDNVTTSTPTSSDGKKRLIGLVSQDPVDLIDLLPSGQDVAYVIGDNRAVKSNLPFPTNILVRRETDIADFIDGVSVLLVSALDDQGRAIIKQALRAGIPIVMRAGLDDRLLKHEKTGFYFGTTSWGVRWLITLLNDSALYNRIAAAAKESSELPDAATTTSRRPPVNNVTVSIITPTFHRDLSILARCVDSLKAQEIGDWELLICSDGEFESPVADFVCRQRDSRIAYYRTATWKGDYGASVRNFMLNFARGKYVCFLDDDNILLPTYLSRMIDAIEAANVDFAICGCLHFGPLKQQPVIYPVVIPGTPPRKGSIDTIQVVCKTAVIRKIGWDKGEGYYSDGVTYERLAQGNSYTVLPEVLAVHL